MGKISSSQSQQWQLKPTKTQEQIPSDFDLSKIKGEKPAVKDDKQLMGPPASAEPKDQVKIEKYRLKEFDKEFKMPSLEDDIKKAVGDLGKGEKAVLGGALAAGKLATGNLKVKMPLSEQSSISLDIRTKPNKSAERFAKDPGEFMMPDVKEPKNPGISLGFKTKF